MICETERDGDGLRLAAQSAAGSFLLFGSSLRDWLRSPGSRRRKRGTFRQLAAAYFWGPAAAFFCGFSAVGVLLLPLLAMACGFFPAYTVSCLTAAFGSRGVWLAAALFGLRYLVVIPCFFLLAAPSLRTASARLRFQSRPVEAESRRGWLHFACVCLVLLLGGWVDFRLSPWFLRLLLEPIFS